MRKRVEIAKRLLVNSGNLFNYSNEIYGGCRLNAKISPEKLSDPWTFLHFRALRNIKFARAEREKKESLCASKYYLALCSFVN